MSDEGVRIVKLLLEISLETQFERFRARYENPEKRWKLTEEDIRNRARYDDYTVAYDEMVKRTDERHAPWHRIDANDKREARLVAFDILLKTLGRDVDLSPPRVPKMVDAFFTRRDR